VITGGPGVARQLWSTPSSRSCSRKTIAISLCAPTGRAAKRLSESTGLEAKTIHRLLETDPRTGSFWRNEETPLDCDLLVVDEVSMVDVPLMRAVFRALPTQAALLLVGDVDQLPSVGPGQFLADIIASGAVPVVRLTEIFRQAATSRIITNAHRINQGLMPELAPADGGDFYFVDAADPEEGVRKLVAIVQERIPSASARSDTRHPGALPDEPRRSGCSLAQYPAAERAEPPGEIRIERFGSTFCPGDKVMQIENNYDKEVYNGDLGVVSRFGMEESELAVDFDGRRWSTASQSWMSWCWRTQRRSTRAKARSTRQWSFPLTTQHYVMLQRNLVYTGVTRGKRLVVLVGQRKALAIAVKGVECGGGGRSCGNG